MHDDLDQLDKELAAALKGLNAGQTQAVPAGVPGKWSIQQIAEHLQQTYRASVPVIRARLEKGSPTRAVPSLRQYAGQFVLISLGQFPPGRQAPAAVLPPSGSVPLDGANLRAGVHAELEELDLAAAEGERAFGNARAASHIVLGPLSMQQWRRFHLIHGRHHIKQIWKIRRQQGFDRAID